MRHPELAELEALESKLAPDLANRRLVGSVGLRRDVRSVFHVGEERLLMWCWCRWRVKPWRGLNVRCCVCHCDNRGVTRQLFIFIKVQRQTSLQELRSFRVESVAHLGHGHGDKP